MSKRKRISDATYNQEQYALDEDVHSDDEINTTKKNKRGKQQDTKKRDDKSHAKEEAKIGATQKDKPAHQRVTAKGRVGAREFTAVVSGENLVLGCRARNQVNPQLSSVLADEVVEESLPLFKPQPKQQPEKGAPFSQVYDDELTRDGINETYKREKTKNEEERKKKKYQEHQQRVQKKSRDEERAVETAIQDRHKKEVQENMCKKAHTLLFHIMSMKPEVFVSTYLYDKKTMFDDFFDDNAMELVQPLLGKEINQAQEIIRIQQCPDYSADEDSLVIDEGDLEDDGAEDADGIAPAEETVFVDTRSDATKLAEQQVNQQALNSSSAIVPDNQADPNPIFDVAADQDNNMEEIGNQQEDEEGEDEGDDNESVTSEEDNIQKDENFEPADKKPIQRVAVVAAPARGIVKKTLNPVKTAVRTPRTQEPVIDAAAQREIQSSAMLYGFSKLPEAMKQKVIKDFAVKVLGNIGDEYTALFSTMDATYVAKILDLFKQGHEALIVDEVNIFDSEMSVRVQLACAAQEERFATHTLLYSTLLPSLSRSGDLEIPAKLKPVAVICITTIVAQIIGMQKFSELVNSHFIRFSIKVGAHDQIGKLLQSRISVLHINYKMVVANTLIQYFNIAPSSATKLAETPDMWRTNVFWYLKNKTHTRQNDLMAILPYMDIRLDSDTETLQLFESLISQAQFIIPLKLNHSRPEAIQIAELINVMQYLTGISMTAIAEFFKKYDSKKWILEARKYAQSSVSEEVAVERFDIATAETFLNEQIACHVKSIIPQLTADIIKKEFTHVRGESKDMANAHLSTYTEDSFQIAAATITSICAKYNGVTALLTLPTAGGKSFVLGLAANVYAGNYPVTMLVPDNLIPQTKKMLEPICKESMTIMGYKEFYQKMPLSQVLYIDECDEFFQNMCLYATSITEMHGIYSLNDPLYVSQTNGAHFKKTWRSIVGFSATGDRALQSFVSKTVNPKPALVELPSEYEYKKKQKNRSVAFVGTDNTYNATLKKIDDLALKMPLIIFVENDKVQDLHQYCKDKTYKVYDHKHIPELQDTKLGILIFTSDKARGYNTKFKVTAHVIIQCHLDNEATFVQMIGRSNRTRGINIGTVFFVQQKPGDFDLGKYTCGVAYQEFWASEQLEKNKKLVELVRFVEARCGGHFPEQMVDRNVTDPEIPYVFFNAQQNNKSIRSVEDYEEMKNIYNYQEYLKKKEADTEEGRKRALLEQDDQERMRRYLNAGMVVVQAEERKNEEERLQQQRKEEEAAQKQKEDAQKAEQEKEHKLAQFDTIQKRLEEQQKEFAKKITDMQNQMKLLMDNIPSSIGQVNMQTVVANDVIPQSGAFNSQRCNLQQPPFNGKV